MLKKDLEVLVKQQQQQIQSLKEKVDNNTTKPKGKEEPQVRILYVNTKATPEALHKSLMTLIYGCKPTKKIGKQLMDEDTKTMLNYLKEVGSFQVEYRNFHDIPEKQRVKLGLHPKFSTFIYRK